MSPLVEADLLIVHVGGHDQGALIALDSPDSTEDTFSALTLTPAQLFGQAMTGKVKTLLFSAPEKYYSF